MKAHIHIAAIMAAMLIGNLQLDAQRTAQREKPTERKTRATQTHTKKASQATPARRTQATTKKTTVERTAPARKTQTATKRTTVERNAPARRTQATTQRTTVERNAPARRTQATTQRTTVERNAPARRTQATTQRTAPEQRTRTVQKNHAQRPAQTQTAHRQARQVTKATPKHKPEIRRDHRHYSGKHYYSGHHYHHVYPKRQIKTHFHHDTYVHHYHVLHYPVYHEMYWTRNMYHDYRRWYPNYDWRYRYGYRIQTISAFDAYYNMGEVATVYGRVSATWYNRDSDDYLLFFGGDYPNQAFTIVLPGRIARKYSWRPERYFLGEHMTITGLITTYDGVPEIIVKNKRQFDLY